MADSVVRLKIDSKEYDSKIKRAAENVRTFGENCRKAGQSVDKAEKETIDYVRSLGRMETAAKSSKGRVNEMTNAFTDLSLEYKKLTDQEKQSPFGKALAQSLDQLKGRIRDTKNELAALNSELGQKHKVSVPDAGGFLGGGKLDGMLAVFGGNLLTKVAGLAASIPLKMASEIGDCVKQGIELAKAGEGVRIAFDRLNRSDILAKLREATHGTVTDIELMKQAVKFNDFKLPIDEMGTMLAFAQQKAKDTGQSVDYMVDSIVTGLGRQSLQILDNLGISASDVKERMKETGDMTKAVGAIIREQMANSGDYVETAADRAAQANVSLQNKMEELGRKFAPVQEASDQLWTSMKIAILDVVGGPLARMINGLTEAGRLRNALYDLNGDTGRGNNTKIGQQLKKLEVIRKAGGSDFVYNSTKNDIIADYNRQIESYQKQIDDSQKTLKTNIGGVSANKGLQESIRDITTKRDAVKSMLNEFIAGEKELAKPVKETTTTTFGTTTTTTTPKTGRVNVNRGGTPPPPEGSIAAQEAKVQALTKAWRMATNEVGRAGYAGQLEEAKKVLDEMQGKNTNLAPEGSLKYMNNQLHELQQKRETLSDPIEINIIDDKIAKVKKDIEALNNGDVMYFSLKLQEDEVTKRLEELKAKRDLTLDTTQIDTALAKLKQLSEQHDAKVNVEVMGDAVGVLQAQLANLSDKTVKAGVEVDTTQIDAAIAELKQLSEQPDTDVNVNVKVVSDAVGVLQAQLEGIKESIVEVKVDVNTDEIEQLEKQLDEIHKLRNREKKEDKPKPLTLEQKIAVDISDERLDADINSLANLMRVKIENGLEGIDIPTDYIQEALKHGMNIPDDYWQALVDEINAKLAELDLDPITIDVKTGNVTQTAKEVEEGWQEAAKAVQAVGGALQQIEDPGAKIAGLIGQAVANIALGFAQATAAASGSGIFGWIAAIAGGLGTMISTISAIHSATGYAEGGIIKGNSYSGDNIMANGGTIGLNAGELVLNRAQQGSIAAQLSDVRGGGERQPYLDVETIWLGISNHLKRRGMGEIVTTKG